MRCKRRLEYILSLFTFDEPVAEDVPVDEKVAAADKSVETGDLAPLAKLMAPELIPELEKRFAKVLKLKDYDPDDVDAGRAYVQAYVSFFKFAEGEDHDHDDHHH